MPVTSPQSEPTSDLESRTEPRGTENHQFQILLESDGSTTTPELSAWSYNRSKSGICFRCREDLPDRVRIQLADEEPASLQIVHRRLVAANVWEYGGALVELAEDKETVLTDDHLLDCAEPSQYAKRSHQNALAREELESMRVLANCSARLAIHDHRMKHWIRRARITGTVACIGFGSALAANLGYLPRDTGPFMLALGAISAIEWLRTLPMMHRRPPVAPSQQSELKDS